MNRPLATLSTLLVTLVGTSAVRAGFVVEGRCLDAAASTQLFRNLQAQGQPWQGAEEKWYVTLGFQDVRIQLVGTQREWTVKTDGDGRFSLDTGLDALSETARMVALHERDGETLYSPSFDPRGSDRDLFLYPPTDASREVVARLSAVHDIAPQGDQNWIRVRVSLSLDGISSGIYVGSTEGSPYREVFRIPLPDGAEIVRNTGMLPGLKWKQSTDRRWLIIDEPVPGLPDTLKASHGGESQRQWEVEYLAPPRQYLALNYTFPVSCQRMTAYALGEDMKVISRYLQLTQRSVSPGSDGRTRGNFDRYDSAEWMPPGQNVLLALEVSNVAVRQVSVQALKWHGGFVLISLVAVLGGLVLGLLGGSRDPFGEVPLTGLSRDEVLDAIVEIDRRFSRGKLAERDYRRMRGALVELVARDLAGSGELAAPAAEEGAGIPAAAGDLLRRLEELDRSGSASPEAIQERAHLLEALYKTLKQKQEPPRDGGSR